MTFARLLKSGTPGSYAPFVGLLSLVLLSSVWLSGCAMPGEDAAHAGASISNTTDGSVIAPDKLDELMLPCPVISRGAKVVSSSGNASNINNGHYGQGPAWKPRHLPASISMNVGQGASTLLLTWFNAGAYSFNDTAHGAPRDYDIEVSADSTNGTDGTWETIVTVTDNQYRQREHSFHVDGDTWVRMNVTAAWGNSGVSLDNIDVFDASRGHCDSWIFIGDSITNIAFAPSHDGSPDFASDIHMRYPSFWPLAINAGQNHMETGYGITNTATLLETFPDVRFWCIAYGTNDAWQMENSATFKNNLERIIAEIVAANKVPIISRIPWARQDMPGSHPADADIQRLNAIIDQVVTEHGLPIGPDAYDAVKGRNDYFNRTDGNKTDGVHFGPSGGKVINNLWAHSAMRLYYTPGVWVPDPNRGPD